MPPVKSALYTNCTHNLLQHDCLCTVRDTEFRASFSCHFKKLRCKPLFIVNVTFKSQILKFIFCARRSHVEVNNVNPILHFLTVY
jgi:hypothetical protein